LPNFEEQGYVGDGVGVGRRQRFLFFSVKSDTGSSFRNAIRLATWKVEFVF